MNSRLKTVSETSLNPRKSPVQTRSVATVEAIQAATIQVLADKGLVMCTTSRIAERAGVSVGSLYQYYPNRSALLAAVLGRHLDHVAETVEQACIAQRMKPLSDMAYGVVHAFIGAKMEYPAASKALYAVAEEHGGAVLVARARKRMHKAVALMLGSAPDSHFDELNTVSFLTMSAMIGPVQALLEEEESPEITEALRTHLCKLVLAYLLSVSR